MRTQTNNQKKKNVRTTFSFIFWFGKLAASMEALNLRWKKSVFFVFVCILWRAIRSAIDNFNSVRYACLVLVWAEPGTSTTRKQFKSTILFCTHVSPIRQVSSVRNALSEVARIQASNWCSRIHQQAIKFESPKGKEIKAETRAKLISKCLETSECFGELIGIKISCAAPPALY